MRQRYLVCYDIANARRLRAVFKKMHGFGDPIQYSVFKCDLSLAEKALMIAALNDLLNTRQDRVMIVRLGPLTDTADDRVDFLGQPLAPWERQRAVVV